jgi:hypothetical protein
MKIQAGTISHGTLRTVDLLSSFAAELERIGHEDDSDLIAEARAAVERIGVESIHETESDSDLVSELQDRLNDRAPAGLYFGNTEGDGSDFGFWPNEDGRRAAAAEEFAAAFQRKQRDNGESFICLKDGSPEWMSDAIRAAHGDKLPNDWSYRIARECVDAMAEILADDCSADITDSDVAWERIDGLVPVYNAERLQWLASHLDRVDYCDSAAAEGLLSDESTMMDRIGVGMFEEYRDVWSILSAAIVEAAE